MARVGVMISGCGYLDGAEIQESVFTLLALSKRGHEIVPIAPELPQSGVIDHRNGKAVEGEQRLVSEEAARIFRAAPVGPAEAGELDALVMPGGYGAAKNLCDFAVKGPDCVVQPEVRQLIQKMVRAGKPLGAWCIAPALVAASLRGEPSVQLTIGDDPDTAKALEAMGAQHVECAVTGCVVDQEHKVVSTPAYMYDAEVHEVRQGIERAVDALDTWLNQ
jgi:enhancing lycopene biosynthesis protein 2